MSFFRTRSRWKSAVALASAVAFLHFAQGSISTVLAADTGETWPKKPVEPGVEKPAKPGKRERPPPGRPAGRKPMRAWQADVIPATEAEFGRLRHLMSAADMPWRE